MEVNLKEVSTLLKDQPGTQRGKRAKRGKGQAVGVGKNAWECVQACKAPLNGFGDLLWFAV